MIRLPQDVLQSIEHAETVVVPSRQRSEAVRLAYAAGQITRGHQAWPSPDVLPLETWKDREIERRAASGEKLPRLLSAAEEWCLWRQSAAELTQDLDLVARGPLAESLLRASHLAQDFRISLAKARTARGSEGRLLFDVYQLVQQKTRALGATTASELASQLFGLGGRRAVLAAGFTQPTPGFQALVESRQAQGCSTRLRVPLADSANQTRAVLATDASEELERIADWCRERLNVQPDARLLVIAPGALEARERLVTLIRQTIDPHKAAASDLSQLDSAPLVVLEGGMPLSRAPLVAHALRTLTWLAEGSEFSDFSSWLTAPYWGVREDVRVRLDLWLRERLPLEITPRELLTSLAAVPEALSASAQSLAAKVAEALRELSVGRATLLQWSERFVSALDALDWPGRTLDSDEAQTFTRFKKLLDDFRDLAASTGPVSRESAVQWLGELAARTSFQPASGDVLVTVSSELTDPIVCYDGIWVAGLQADAWPQAVQPDPFLPLDGQISAGVPAATAAGRAAEAQSLMAAWRASTSELMLSSPLRAEDVQLAPSPLLEPYVKRPLETVERTSLWLPLQARQENVTEHVEDLVGIPWDVSVRVPSGTRSVELQNLCPFRAYGELRLGSSELDAPEPGVAADVRGRLLHAALEKLWSVLRGSEGLLAQTDESLEVLIARAVQEAATELMGPERAEGWPGVNRRECRRTARLIRSLCDVERKRAPFTVRKTELERNLQLAGAQLRIRIDRLDELSTGGLAILDYKSGRSIPGDWYSERPSHPQLLVYLAAVGDETVAMATVSVTAREIRFDGVAADASLLPRVRAVEEPADAGPGETWAHWQRKWHAKVEQLAADFVRGNAVVDPRPKACEYCQVVSVCRIADASATAVEQNIDD